MREAVKQLDGLYVGQLDEDQMELFEVAVERGYARRSFDGPGGMLGLAKVEFIWR